MRNLAFINEMQSREGSIDAKEIPHEKNDFAEVSESLDADLKIILSNHPNNYVERSSWLLERRYSSHYCHEKSSIEKYCVVGLI